MGFDAPSNTQVPNGVLRFYVELQTCDVLLFVVFVYLRLHGERTWVKVLHVAESFLTS